MTARDCCLHSLHVWLAVFVQVSINGAQAWEAERQHMQQLYGNKPAAALLSDQTIPLVTQVG